APARRDRRRAGAAGRPARRGRPHAGADHRARRRTAAARRHRRTAGRGRRTRSGPATPSLGGVYEYGVDFDAVTAIDMHAHIEIDCHGHQAYDDELVAATTAYFKMDAGPPADVDAVADYYRDRKSTRLNSSHV